MNILLVDDNPEILKRIEKDLFKYFSEHVEKVNFYSYSSHFSSINIEYDYDFVFIDIDLVDENGIELVSTIKEIHPNIKVVFLSSYLNLIHDSLFVQPFYFIRKANYEEDLNKFFLILNKLEKVNQIIELNYKNTKHKINVQDIYYISSFGHELTIVAKSGTFSDNRKLKEILEYVQLHHYFVRIHKSYIINLDYLKSYKHNVIYMIDGAEINLGRIYKLEFENKYREFLLK